MWVHVCKMVSYMHREKRGGLASCFSSVTIWRDEAFCLYANRTDIFLNYSVSIYTLRFYIQHSPLRILWICLSSTVCIQDLYVRKIICLRYHCGNLSHGWKLWVGGLYFLSWLFTRLLPIWICLLQGHVVIGQRVNVLNRKRSKKFCDVKLVCCRSPKSNYCICIWGIPDISSIYRINCIICHIFNLVTLIS